MSNNTKTSYIYDPLDYRSTLLALPYEQRRISINDEFIVDYEYGRFYMNKDNSIVELSRDELIDMVNDSVNALVGINVNSTDFSTLISNINIVNGWIDKHTGINDTSQISTFEQISSFLAGMQNFNIKHILDSKINAIPGKMLSDNNFSDDEKDKLETIDNSAAPYAHPVKYVCNINRGVYRLNGHPEPGSVKNINLTLHDIGLGNIDKNANNYSHPPIKQCSEPMIETLNGMSGDVVLNKLNLGLSEIKDMSLSDPNDYTSNNKYAVPSIIENYLSHLEEKGNMKGTDSYIYENIVVIIKSTQYGQSNEISYTPSNNKTVETSVNVHIDDLYAFDKGRKLMILSDGELLLYEYKNSKYTEVNIFINDKSFDINIIINNRTKSIIEPIGGVYGVVLTNSDNMDFVYLWGRITERSKVYNNGIEKVEVRNDIMYILFDTGKVIYKEYLNGLINTSYRNILLTYNDIIDIFVREDFIVCMRGNRDLLVAGDDTVYNNNIVSDINSIKTIPYKIYIKDDTGCILSIDNRISVVGRKIGNIQSSRLEFPIEKVSIYKDSIILIDSENNIINIK